MAAQVSLFILLHLLQFQFLISQASLSIVVHSFNHLINTIYTKIRFVVVSPITDESITLSTINKYFAVTIMHTHSFTSHVQILIMYLIASTNATVPPFSSYHVISLHSHINSFRMFIIMLWV